MHEPERSRILGLHPAHQHVFEVMLISQFLIETLALRVLDEANRDLLQQHWLRRGSGNRTVEKVNRHGSS
jgi:hypothetical protein